MQPTQNFQTRSRRDPRDFLRIRMNENYFWINAWNLIFHLRIKMPRLRGYQGMIRDEITYVTFRTSRDISHDRHMTPRCSHVPAKRCNKSDLGHVMCMNRMNSDDLRRLCFDIFSIVFEPDKRAENCFRYQRNFLNKTISTFAMDPFISTAPRTKFCIEKQKRWD